MTFYLQLAVAGIAVGSVYALIAIGIVLIYKCSGVVNFAQGAFVMLGAYFTFALTRLGLAPEQTMMVAAHPWDLRAAAAHGMRTAYVARPGEGLPAAGDRFEICADDLAGLARMLVPGA